MADKPDWVSITSEETHITTDTLAAFARGRHTGFDAGARPVEVDTSSLRTFADAVARELSVNVAPNSAAVLDRLTAPPGGAPQRTFGVDPRNDWAKMIGDFHLECEGKAQALLGDLQRGLQAIATAAAGIAADYHAADDEAAVDVARIRGYFNAAQGGGLNHQVDHNPRAV